MESVNKKTTKSFLITGLKKMSTFESAENARDALKAEIDALDQRVWNPKHTAKVDEFSETFDSKTSKAELKKYFSALKTLRKKVDEAKQMQETMLPDILADLDKLEKLMEHLPHKQHQSYKDKYDHWFQMQTNLVAEKTKIAGVLTKAIAAASKGSAKPKKRTAEEAAIDIPSPTVETRMFSDFDSAYAHLTAWTQLSPKFKAMSYERENASITKLMSEFDDAYAIVSKSIKLMKAKTIEQIDFGKLDAYGNALKELLETKKRDKTPPLQPVQASEDRVKCPICRQTKNDFLKSGLCSICFFQERVENAQDRIEMEMRHLEIAIKERPDQSDIAKTHADASIKTEKLRDLVFAMGEHPRADKIAKQWPVISELITDLEKMLDIGIDDDEDEGEDYGEDDDEEGPSDDPALRDSMSIGSNEPSDDDIAVAVNNKRKGRIANPFAGLPEQEAEAHFTDASEEHGDTNKLADNCMRTLARLPVESIQKRILKLYSEGKFDMLDVQLKEYADIKRVWGIRVEDLKRPDRAPTIHYTHYVEQEDANVRALTMDVDGIVKAVVFGIDV